MSTKYNFYDVVKIVPCKDVPKRLWGTLGVIVGRTTDIALPIEYGVQLDDDDGNVWQLGPEHLEPTSERRCREAVFSGQSISVASSPRHSRDDDN